MNILGIGETVIDKSITIDGYAREGTKVNACEEHISVGGPVATALVLLSRLGVTCNLVTSIAHDYEGNLISKTLREENIKLTINNQSKTKVNMVITNKSNGSRTIIKSTTTHKKIQNIPLKLLGNADIILFDRHEPEAFEFVLKNKKSHTKIISDPSTEVSLSTLKLIKNSTYAIIPIEIFDDIKNILTPEELIITAGHEGTYILKKNKLVHEPTYKVDVKDTLGAGDIYRGAFAYGILKGWKTRKSVRFANLVSSLHCTRIGNTTAIPTKEEIKEFSKIAIKNEATSLSLVNLQGSKKNV